MASALGASSIAPPRLTTLEEAVVARIDTTASGLPLLLADAAAAFAETIVAQPWDGVCRIGLNDTQAIDTVRALAARYDAPCVIERCPSGDKHEIDVFGPPPPSFGLMRAIKQEFDPNGVLSPGRFVGRL